MPEKISVVIITHNEEKRIRRCLESVLWADEIIVVDSGSTDQTVAIAGSLGAKVIVNPWPGYSAQKNIGLAQASFDWALCLDADEFLGPELISEIIALRERGLTNVDGYLLPRWTTFLGEILRHGGVGPEYKLRLFDRRKGRWSKKEPHEYVVLEGKTSTLAHPFFHDSFFNLSHHQEKLMRYARLIAQNEHANRVRFRVFDLLRIPLSEFFRMYVLEQGFRDGIRGLIFCLSYGYYFFLRQAFLFELVVAEKAKTSVQPPNETR